MVLWLDAMIHITGEIWIDPRHLQERFVRASGPGGQHVNKVATAVELRFDVAGSRLPDEVKARLTRLAGARMSEDGVLLIDSRAHRTQGRNREAALERLIALVRRAAVTPKRRKPTKPRAAARERRLASKKRRGDLKQSRSTAPGTDE